MVFGQLADSVPILGSQRRAYVFIGASLVASGLIILAGAAGGWIAFAGKNALYVTAQLLIVIGVVLQDVVADAMTTEVVDRERPDGTPQPKAEIDRELGLVQVLGRLALWSGILSVAGLSGWLAQIVQLRDGVPARADHSRPSRSPAPCWSVSTASTPKPIDWRILGGGIAVRRRGPRHRPRAACRFGQELVFVISLTVIALMLVRIAADARRAASQAHLLCRACHLPLSRQPRGRGGLSLVHHRRARLRRSVLRHAGADRRGAQPRRRLAVLRCHHPPADRQGAAMADHRRHRAVAADASRSRCAGR